MKHTYVTPQCETMDCISTSSILTISGETYGINNDHTGGDDGLGGYDPGKSLSRGNRVVEGSIWDNAW